MPDNAVDPFRGHRYSEDRLRQTMGRYSPEYDSLRRFATNNVVHYVDDFLGDAINLDNYAVATGGGAASAVFALSVAPNGIIRATTGTASGVTTIMSLITPAIFLGDLNPEVIFRFRPTTAVTETQIEVGFVDVVPTSNLVVNSVVTPTVNASIVDAAVYHYRHATATTTNQLITIGTSLAAQKTNFTAVPVIAAATYYTVRIKIVTNDVFMWFNGRLVASHAAAIEGGSALAVWAAIEATNGTSKSLDLDFIEWTQDRV